MVYILWLHYNYILVNYGYTMLILSLPMVTFWLTMVYTMLVLSLPMVTSWLHYGYIMVTLWLHYG